MRQHGDVPKTPRFGLEIEMPSRQFTCHKCGASFSSKAPTAKYCSKACWSIRASLDRICLQCNATFRIERNRIATAKYCSTTCQSLARTFDLVVKHCLSCGDEFRVHVKHKNQQYCNAKCFGVAYADKVVRECLHCKNDFSVPKSRGGRRRYCSMECKRLAQSVEIVCSYCKLTVTVARSSAERQFCSNACRRSAGDVRMELSCSWCKKIYLR